MVQSKIFCLVKCTKFLIINAVLRTRYQQLAASYAVCPMHVVCLIVYVCTQSTVQNLSFHHVCMKLLKSNINFLPHSQLGFVLRSTIFCFSLWVSCGAKFRNCGETEFMMDVCMRLLPSFYQIFVNIGRFCGVSVYMRLLSLILQWCRLQLQLCKLMQHVAHNF